jgi:tetratricopeptide (TPR) repeat protein
MEAFRWRARASGLQCAAVVMWLAASAVLAQQTELPSRAETPDLTAALAAVRALVDAGKPADALQKLGLLDQGDARVQQLTGVALYHADRHQDAIDVLQRVRERLPGDSLERRETEQVLGLALFLRGRFADAIPWLEKTRASLPDNAELDYTLGQAYIQTRQPEQARAALARTFGVPPDSAAAGVLAAQLMIRLQMESMAETELLAAVQRDPRVPRANFLLGQLALFRGKLDEAVTLSQREIALNPSDAMAFYQMGDAYVRQGRWDDGIRALQQSLWINPFYSGPYILLGRAYMKKQQPATAEGMLRRAIAYDPNNRTAHYLLAQLLQQMGREEEARQEFAIAERLDTRGDLD